MFTCHLPKSNEWHYGNSLLSISRKPYQTKCYILFRNNRMTKMYVYLISYQINSGSSKVLLYQELGAMHKQLKRVIWLTIRVSKLGSNWLASKRDRKSINTVETRLQKTHTCKHYRILIHGQSINLFLVCIFNPTPEISSASVIIYLSLERSHNLQHHIKFNC